MKSSYSIILYLLLDWTLFFFSLLLLLFFLASANIIQILFFHPILKYISRGDDGKVLIFFTTNQPLLTFNKYYCLLFPILQAVHCLFVIVFYFVLFCLLCTVCTLKRSELK